MGKWFKEHVWTTTTVAFGAAWAAVSKMLDVLGVLTMGDQLDIASSYWFKFLDWWFSMPSWISGIFLATVLVISISRHHPALIVAANKFKRSDPRIRICANMRRAASRLGGALGAELPARYSREEREYLAEIANWTVTALDLERMGFRVPSVDIERDPQVSIRTILDFVSRIEPLMSAGYLKQAKKEAAKLAA